MLFSLDLKLLHLFKTVSRVGEPLRHKPLLHTVGNHHQRGWRRSTPGGSKLQSPPGLYGVFRRRVCHSRANMAFQTCCLQDLAWGQVGRLEPEKKKGRNFKLALGCSYETPRRRVLFFKMQELVHWIYSIGKGFLFGLRKFGRVWIWELTCVRNSWCSTHLRVGLHCLSSPPAFVLFVDSIKQMVREPITQEGVKWNHVCMCVDMYVFLCACPPPPSPSPCGFLGGFLSPYVLEVRGRVIIEHSLVLLTNVLKEGIEKPVNGISLPGLCSGILFL